MIRVENLSGGYGKQSVVKQVDLHVKAGEFYALLGPNGSGKSTVFKLITGVLPAATGTVELKGRPLASLSVLDKARMVAVLGQEERVSFDFTVEEIVALGRYPHQTGMFKLLSAEDRRIIREAMELCHVQGYRDKPFAYLSGGEKQRVMLAKALAQQPEVLLLDEPTNHLDIRHTFELLGLVKELQRTQGLTVLAILHDLNVASLYADRIALLKDGRIQECGSSMLLLHGKKLEQVYGVRVKSQFHAELARPQISMSPHHLGGSGPSADFLALLELKQDSGCLHVQSARPLRTLSTGVVGGGFGWARHYCNFRVGLDYDCTDPVQDMREMLAERGIPAEEAVGMMTAVLLEDAAVRSMALDAGSCMVVATAGTGNAVDAASELAPIPLSRPGTINVMIFVDGRLTDGAMVNALMTATEGKAKALADLGVTDRRAGTLATGTSTDSMVIAATHIGEPTPYAGSGTVIGKRIGRLVYEAVRESAEAYLRRREADAVAASQAGGEARPS